MIVNIENCIGRRIQKEMLAQGYSYSQFAEAISTSRSNTYNIVDRFSIDTALLHRISLVLGHNFLADLAEEVDRDLANKTNKSFKA